jgi:hypothetical protein
MNHRLTVKAVDVDVLSNSFKRNPKGVHIELVQWPLHREVLNELQQVLLGIEQTVNRELQSVQDVTHLQRGTKLLNLQMYS